MTRLRDNLDYFELEDIRQAMWEASLPVCDCCGEHIAEYYEVHYHGAMYVFCKECCQERYVEEE